MQKVKFQCERFIANSNNKISISFYKMVCILHFIFNNIQVQRYNNDINDDDSKTLIRMLDKETQNVYIKKGLYQSCTLTGEDFISLIFCVSLH